MHSFFDNEGPFFQAVLRIMDVLYLSFLFLLCSLPIVTIGASFCGLYYAAHKNIRHGHGYVGSEFFRGFKENFKQATPIWLMFLAIYGVLGTECYLMYQYAINGQSFGKVYILLMIVIAMIVVWNIYVFPYMARFQNKSSAILKNAAFFAAGNFGRSLTLFVFLFFMMLLVVSWPWLIVIVPGAYAEIAEFSIEKIFRKYMTPEDIAEEDERNREYKN